MTNKLKTSKGKKKNIILVVIALFAVIGAGLIIYSNAATPTQPSSVTTLAGGPASLSLNPASGNFASGTTIAAGIYVDSGSAEVSTVDVKLNYDTTKLDFVSIDGSGGALSTCTENTGGSGNASLVCTKLGGSITGNQKIGNVNFRTKVNSGISAVSFSANSHVYAYAATLTELWNGDTSGGSYTLGSTTTPPTGTGTTTTPTTSGGGSSTPTSGSSGGSKTTPKTTTSGGSSPTSSSATPTTTVDGVPVTDDTSSAGGTVATTSATKLNTNAIIMYAAIVGGVIVLVSASGVTFARLQRKKKFNRAHGIGNTAVVFDANTSVHNPQTNSIDQGPIVAPSAPSAPAQTNGPQGNIITPNNDVKPQ